MIDRLAGYLHDLVPTIVVASLPATLYADIDTKVAIWCVFGGLFGGYVGIWLTPKALAEAARENPERPRQWAYQWGVALACSFIFGPMAVWYFDALPERLHACVFVGGTIGAFAWCAVLFWKAFIWRKVKAWIDRYLEERKP